ncbi:MULTISPECIES: DUF1203 domain-containing protein [Kordiimonas]|jgi:hypothetical protein|uniref:DUF1203 domain-containing protein n=1 Tax=Kordiimonas TaxID=288021 RepID=UPI00257B9ABC|nr:DUF1203 domain-containing protein [Kordiimonas sp. UBA4487]
MTALKVIAMPTSKARAYQRGGVDANGRVPEKEASTGPGNPCRHCLQTIEAGAEKLVLAYRPFHDLQPYAELGPIFLHGRECDRHDEAAGFPSMFSRWGTVMVRGYGTDNRIQYQAARHVTVDELESQCTEMLNDPNVAYLHVRTSQYNCYQCRVERA